MSSMHSPKVIDHFEYPRNSGAMDSPDVIVKTENPACGDAPPVISSQTPISPVGILG